MILLVTTVIMLLLVVGVVVMEYRNRRKIDLERYDAMLDTLGTRAHARYVEKFGKDPTGQFPLPPPKSKK